MLLCKPLEIFYNNNYMEQTSSTWKFIFKNLNNCIKFLKIEFPARWSGRLSKINTMSHISVSAITLFTALVTLKINSIMS